ncbi:MAG: CapA family protein [Syntrophales bacterium]|jgi:poly-gamma-glutamate synthesis protein (capsule biosynthesis protein)
MKDEFPTLNPNIKTSLCFVGDYTPSINNGSTVYPIGQHLIGNIECSISDTPINSGKAYPIFMNSDCFEPVVSHNFIALNLANNHVYDAGNTAFDNMVTGLRKGIPDVQFYGLKDAPYAEVTLNNKYIAIIGCLEPCRSRGPRLFREENVSGLIRKIRNNFDYVFVTPHWGKEGEYAFHPSPWQRRLAGNWINAGADGIFGHHSHTMQGYEEIQGKPVFYSLGNFLFNHEEGRKYPLTQLGLSVTYEIVEKGIWNHTFFIQDGSSIKYIEGNLFNQASSFLEKISNDICCKPWAMQRWAKTVGPIYIPKSAASWKIRFKRGPFYKVFPLWFLWFLLPLNLILRWGNFSKSETIIQEAKHLDSLLIKYLHNDSKD